MLAASQSSGVPLPSSVPISGFVSKPLPNSSGHPSPTESDHGGSTGSKTSRSADLPDTHSESSEISPSSPHSDSSDNKAPQDLSVQKHPPLHPPPDRENSFESGHLDLKCKHCGCLFGDETLLAMHIQETHAPGGHSTATSNGNIYHHQYLHAALQGNPGAYFPSYAPDVPQPVPTSESDAIASLLALQQKEAEEESGQLPASTVGGKPKIFNPEAYCDVCNKEFCNKYYLQTHKATKHGAAFPPHSFSLLPPSRSASFASLLQDQIQQHHQQSFDPTTTTTPSSLGGHQMAGLLANPPPYSSDSNNPPPPTVASYSTPSDPSLEADCKCPYCGQNFPTQYHLQSHIISLHPSAIAGSNMLNSQAAAIQAMYTAQLMGSFNGNGGSPNPFGNPFLDRVKMMAGLMGGQQPPSSGPELSFQPPELHSYLHAMSGAYPESMMGLGDGESPPQQQQNGVNHVVNKDAFCELCQKEFCNKYFLKTHKQKKHGIPIEDSPSSSGRKRSYGDIPNTPNFPSSVIANLFQRSQSDEPPLKISPPTSSEMMSSVIKINPQQQQPQTPQENGVAPQEEDFSPRALQIDDARPTEIKEEAVDEAEQPAQFGYQCSVCRKSFQSSLMLLAHSYNEHPPQGGMGLESLLMGQFNPNAVNGSSRTPLKDGSLPSGSGPVDPEAFCELCQKEFCSKYFLKTHKQNIHGMMMDFGAQNAATPPSGLNLAAMIQAAASPKRSSGSLSRKSSLDSPKEVKTPSSGGRPRFITGKNFCEICNKEVCNKYFLRTHMLKMHGIVIDENKPIIANINTLDKEKLGTIKFRCTLCSQEMATRNLLRNHKLTVHGIGSSTFEPPPETPEPPPPNMTVPLSNMTPNMTVTSSGPNITVPPIDPAESGEIFSNNRYFDLATPCPQCDRRFKTAKCVDLHVEREHSPPAILDQRSYEKQFAETGAFNCEYCATEFNDFIALQLHTIRQHDKEIRGRAKLLAEQTALDSFNPPANGAIEKTPEKVPTPPAVEEEKKTSSPPMVVRHVNGTKLYRCSYCHYYTKWLSNLSVHEKRHTGDTPREEKPFTCQVCLRAYRYAHSLERHKNVHRYSLLNGSNPLTAKFSGSPLKSPQKWVGTPEKQLDEGVVESGSYSATIATGAKRFRCTKCQKLFKSRELCRSHLFAVHRRQEKLLSLGSEAFDEDDTAFMLDKNDKSAATIAQVVEELHSQKERSKQSELVGYGMPNVRALEQDADGQRQLARPYTRQVFEVEAEGGLWFDKMLLYLPVFARVQEPTEVTLKFHPLKLQNGDIKSL